MRRPAAGAALLFAPAAAAPQPGDVAWTYAVPPNPEASTASQLGAHGGAIIFTTDACVRDFGDGSCVNTTGLLVSLHPRTGAPAWDYRPPGGGVNGQLGFPQAAAPAGPPPASVVVTSAPGFGRKGVFQYAYRAVPHAPLSCAVPLWSGNRKRLLDDDVGAAACRAGAGCWEPGDRCALAPTAQTTDCPGSPVTKADCSAAGCCWDPDYSPGRCFAPSPACYRPAPGAGWASSLTNLSWATAPAVADTAVVGVACSTADCRGLACLPTGCAVQAFAAAGGSLLWRRAVADVCTNITMQTNLALRVATGGGGAYSITCAQTGTPGTAAAGHGAVELRAMSLADGAELWPAVRLSADADAGWHPPAPVYDAGAVYAGTYAGGPGSSSEAVTLRLRAFDAATGAVRWEARAGGYECTALRSEGVAVVAAADHPRGRAVLWWDDFAVRAADAATGAALWDTAALNVTVVGVVPTPSVQGGVVLFHGAPGAGGGCDAMYGGATRVYAVRVSDGSLAGSAAVPAAAGPGYSLTPPVAVGGVWAFGWIGRFAPPQVGSTVFALHAPPV